MDWKKPITEIQSATGMSQAALGTAVGRSQAWVADIMSGRYDDVKWRDGEALRKLHAERCPTVGADTPAPATHQEAA